MGGTDVEEGARAGFGLEAEVALVPDDTFVVEELRNLRVSSRRGHGSVGCGGEVILFVVLADDVGMGVLGVAVVVDGAGGGVERAAGRLVDEVVPVAIEAGGGSMVEADYECLKGLLGDCGSGEGGEEQETAQRGGGTHGQSLACLTQSGEGL